MKRQERAQSEAGAAPRLQTGHEHIQSFRGEETSAKTVLTIRAHSGLSGDMFLAGMLRLTDMGGEELSGLLASILPGLADAVRLDRGQVQGIGGWRVRMDLPRQHEHRRLGDIEGLLGGSALSDRARELALATFALLAGAEARVHDIAPEEVHFHEVGALDSIIDVALGCELFCRLAPDVFTVSPLPVADGEISCAHGILPSPAPAVLELIAGIPLRPFAGQGETVTPTAIALLRSLDAVFGPWPAMCVQRQALVYGAREFPGVANGAVFAYGPLC